MRIGRKKETNQDHRAKTDPYYQSREWKRKRDKVWKRDKSLCQICADKNIIHPLARGTKYLDHQGTVDHIIPRNAGGSDELSNLRLVGSRCHAKKSGQDKKYYSK